MRAGRGRRGGLAAEIAPAMVSLLMVRLALPSLPGSEPVVEAMDESLPLYLGALVVTVALVRGVRRGGRWAMKLLTGVWRRWTAGTSVTDPMSFPDRAPPFLFDLCVGQLLFFLMVVAAARFSPRPWGLPMWLVGLNGCIIGFAVVGMLMAPKGRRG